MIQHYNIDFVDEKTARPTYLLADVDVYGYLKIRMSLKCMWFAKVLQSVARFLEHAGNVESHQLRFYVTSVPSFDIRDAYQISQLLGSRSPMVSVDETSWVALSSRTSKVYVALKSHVADSTIVLLFHWVTIRQVGPLWKCENYWNKVSSGGMTTIGDRVE
ncbi:hypothetical protein PtrSN001C_009099, partial [Pyrenophora tritici-repentis]